MVITPVGENDTWVPIVTCALLKATPDSMSGTAQLGRKKQTRKRVGSKEQRPLATTVSLLPKTISFGEFVTCNLKMFRYNNNLKRDNLNVAGALASTQICAIYLLVVSWAILVYANISGPSTSSAAALAVRHG